MESTRTTSPLSRWSPPFSPSPRSSPHSLRPGRRGGWISWRYCAPSRLASARLEDQCDCLGNALVRLRLTRELLPSRGRDPIVARAAVLGGASPFILQPALDQHALKRGV